MYHNPKQPWELTFRGRFSRFLELVQCYPSIQEASLVLTKPWFSKILKTWSPQNRAQWFITRFQIDFRDSRSYFFPGRCQKPRVSKAPTNGVQNPLLFCFSGDCFTLRVWGGTGGIKSSYAVPQTTSGVPGSPSDTSWFEKSGTPGTRFPKSGDFRPFLHLFTKCRKIIVEGYDLNGGELRDIA